MHFLSKNLGLQIFGKLSMNLFKFKKENLVILEKFKLDSEVLEFLSFKMI